MDSKDTWSRISGWLQAHNPFKGEDYHPQIDNEGLISEDAEPTESAGDDKGTQRTRAAPILPPLRHERTHPSSV